MAEAKSPRVLIADDYPPIAAALGRLLARDCEIVGTVDDCQAVLDATTRLQPDIVLLDLHLAGGHGLETCAAITRTSPRTKVIVLTSGTDPTLQVRALAAGASAFIDKAAVGTELLAAIADAQDATDPKRG